MCSSSKTANPETCWIQRKIPVPSTSAYVNATTPTHNLTHSGLNHTYRYITELNITAHVHATFQPVANTLI